MHHRLKEGTSSRLSQKLIEKSNQEVDHHPDAGMLLIMSKRRRSMWISASLKKTDRRRDSFLDNNSIIKHNHLTTSFNTKGPSTFTSYFLMNYSKRFS